MTTTSTLTARTPEDLLAVVRVVLGFEPARSIVMLTLGAAHQFHARVDLPEQVDDLDEVVEVLLRPAAGHGATAVVFVVYTDDAPLARRAGQVLRARFLEAEIECLEALRVDAGRWFTVAGGGAGVPYDLTAHRFVAGAVLEGRVLHGSRGALAATLAARSGEVAAVEAALPQPRATGRWVAAVVARHAVAGSLPPAAESARLLLSITDPAVRDAAWSALERPDARRHVELWSGLVRRCPDDLVPDASSVLAFAAWLAGDGALAWCAVDRARAVDPGHRLAGLVADLLEGAVPPAVWEHRRPSWGSAS